MPRPLRIDIPDGLYHVTRRGLERRAIVRDDADRQKWTDLLDTVATRHRWRVLAYALMGNHSHLYVRTPDANLSAGMHDLNSGYATAFNCRHGRVGPLFQGRFKAIVVERAAHDWELTRYVHLNPVRAGLAERPEAYRWGSCRFYLSSRGAPDWLAWEDVLREHGRTLRAARRRYRAFLAEGIASPPRSPLRDVVASTLLGSPAFIARMREWLEGRVPDREVPAERALRQRVSSEEIEAAVCEVFGVPVEQLHVRGRWGNEARAMAIHLCRRWTALSLAAIGDRFGGVGYAAVSRTARHTAERLTRDRRLAKRAARCERSLGMAEKWKIKNRGRDRPYGRPPA
jgi:putative transposase